MISRASAYFRSSCCVCAFLMQFTLVVCLSLCLMLSSSCVMSVLPHCLLSFLSWCQTCVPLMFSHFLFCFVNSCLVCVVFGFAPCLLLVRFSSAVFGLFALFISWKDFHILLFFFNSALKSFLVYTCPAFGSRSACHTTLLDRECAFMLFICAAHPYASAEGKIEVFHSSKQ